MIPSSFLSTSSISGMSVSLLMKREIRFLKWHVSFFFLKTRVDTGENEGPTCCPIACKHLLPQDLLQCHCLEARPWNMQHSHPCQDLCCSCCSLCPQYTPHSAHGQLLLVIQGWGWLVSLQWKKMANITLTMWTKLAPSVISHVESRYPWYSVMIKSFKLCSLPPTNMRQLQVEEDSTKCLTNTLKTVKDMKNKDSLRHYYNKDIGQLYIMWYLEWDLKTEEGN